MSIEMPNMVYGDRINKRDFVKFGGYDHRIGAGDGTIWDEQNLTSDYYPVLSPRQPRYQVQSLTKPNGFYCHDGLFWVDGTSFYADGVLKGSVEDSRKTFSSLGAYVIILPDKKYYDRITGTFGSMESTWSGSARFQNGTYAEEEAEGNTISASVTWSSYFKVGDAVTISGAANPDNNKTIIIREIAGGELRFYENSFTVSTAAENLTLTRGMPDIQFICENENRLWGCKGDTVYASKLGDPFNWNVFDGLSTDSYAVDVGSVGDFTACCSYLGYPCFFKEEHIYKCYGDRPSNFQLMGSASLGVETGSERSLAIAGETLFYLCRTGIVAYTGGIPQNLSEVFGNVRYKNAVAGSDGTKYYVSMQDQSGFKMFCYDTEHNIWHREDDKQIVDFGWNGELYFLDSTGKLWMGGNIREAPQSGRESSVTSFVEFGDMTNYASGNPKSGANKKGTSKLQIRMELDVGASVTIRMQFDSDGVWRSVKTLTAETKRSYYLPIIPRRSDHFRIRMDGVGDWKLYSLVHESYSGSEL